MLPTCFDAVVTYFFLGVLHALPAAGALIGNILGARVLTQVGSDLAAVVLHVQEEGSQGTLGRIGVDGGALALLGTTGLGLGTGAACAVGEVLTHQARGANGKLNGGIAALGDVVDVLDVGLAEIGDVGLHLHQAHDDLLDIVRYVIEIGQLRLFVG
jgi:hypothetical protein